jgi:phosphatidylglycerol---prolipoprotein diacylglyceryl transferase
VHSIAFQFGSLTIHWYGILTAAGFLVAFWAASRRAPREGISPDTIMGLAPWIIGGAIVGARALYVISYWKEDFAGQPIWEIFKIRSGLVFYGGLIGSSLGTIIYAWRNNLPLWKLADIIAPSIALGHAFGRIGCLMTGCCYGQACDLPWAIHFPEEHATKGIGVHPTQLYESGLNLLLFMGLSWFYPRKKFDGHVFAIYLIAYAILRAIVEMFRGDYPVQAYYWGFLTPAQLVSLGIFIAGCVLLWALQLPKKTAQM